MWRCNAVVIFVVVVAATNAQAQVSRQTHSDWSKWCGPVTVVSKDKTGTEVRKPREACVTYHERVGAGGTLIVAAALWHIEGEVKQRFVIGMPPEMRVRPGLRVSMFPNDIWEDLPKQEKVHRSQRAKGKMLKVGTTSCRATDCSVTMDATSAFISDLRTNGGLVVFATASSGAPVTVSIPLTGFATRLPIHLRCQRLP